MQKITIIGRLGRDPRMPETQDGRVFLAITVAVDSKYRGIDRTSWYDVTTFDVDKYRNMVQHLKKGSLVVVTGDLYTDVEKGNDGNYRCRRQISADSINFVPGNKSDSNNAQGTETAQERPARATKPTEAETPAEDEPTVAVKPKGTTAKKPAPAPKVEEPEPDIPVDEEEMPF